MCFDNYIISVIGLQDLPPTKDKAKCLKKISVCFFGSINSINRIYKEYTHLYLK